jgi:hypothetical protein
MEATCFSETPVWTIQLHRINPQKTRIFVSRAICTLNEEDWILFVCSLSRPLFNDTHSDWSYIASSVWTISGLQRTWHSLRSCRGTAKCHDSIKSELTFRNTRSDPRTSPNTMAKWPVSKVCGSEADSCLLALTPYSLVKAHPHCSFGGSWLNFHKTKRRHVL